MGCEQWREMLSAQLDGEDDPADRARTDEHLDGCPGCREWVDRAAEVNRLTRTGPAVAVPDLSAAIMAALQSQGDAPATTLETPGLAAGSEAPGSEAPGSEAPGSGAPGSDAPGSDMPRPSVGRGRLVAALFAALGAVGAVQLVLGLAQVGSGGSVDHAHPGVDLAATPGHLWHESAAWNVAVGAAFMVIALRRGRPSGLVPMLSAFVGMLLLLSVNDLSAGRVEVARLVSHGFVITGYLIVVALSRITSGRSRPPAGDRPARAAWRARFEEVEPGPPTLRLVRRSTAAPVVAQAVVAQAVMAQAVVAQAGRPARDRAA